ncbi:MAG: MamI family restriction endonuclease [Rikenellaceae bacterium]|nr:MamI family restriction endonuclease [Rikenellaceae bacterium]
MKPNPEYITIEKDEERIKKLIKELILVPRMKAIEWSKITKQTPNLKIGYPGQHLASLITGIEGSRTGARGQDLRDGSEVKSCSKVDQMDTCTSCEGKVARSENKCPHCECTNIKRKDDSKWLFTIRSEEDLQRMTEKIDRIFLTIAYNPGFEKEDYNTIRLQAFEIWNNNERHANFKKLMTSYFYKIYLEHINNNPNKTPAPKNIWPFSYQFYLCNPVQVFDCLVTNANYSPEIEIMDYFPPDGDRASLTPLPMPTKLLQRREWDLLLKEVPKESIIRQLSGAKDYESLIGLQSNTEKLVEKLPFIDEETRKYLPLRDTDNPKIIKKVE